MHCWSYWWAVMSFLKVAGRALKASFSSRSPSRGSPVIAGQDLERVHRLDHRAELGPLRRAAAGQVLVAGEDAGGLAVVSVELLEHPEDGVLVLRRRR